MDDVVSGFLSGFLDLLLLPLQLVLVPIDALLSKIPDINTIPSAIQAGVDIIGTIPQTVVSILGINPFMWNLVFTVFVFYIGAAPAVQGLKKVWAWVRP